MTPIQRASPVVTIELQLWPQPPADPSIEPYFFGYGTLAFRNRSAPWEHVWEQDLSAVVRHSSDSARVVCKPPHGWFLVLTLRHEKARHLLSHGRIVSTIEQRFARRSPSQPSSSS